MTEDNEGNLFVPIAAKRLVSGTDDDDYIVHTGYLVFSLHICL